jgi:pyruvate carboxylase
MTSFCGAKISVLKSLGDKITAKKVAIDNDIYYSSNTKFFRKC